jgi:hypothetical protein
MSGSSATTCRACNSSSAAAALLGAILAHGSALSAAAELTDQDRDLELIPKATQQPATNPQPATPATPVGTGRFYVENAFSVASFRGNLAVAPPGPRAYDWQERLFFDVNKEWRLADRLSITYSDRLNLRDENDLDFATHENLINDLRELYVDWHALDSTFLDVGRINLKSGVALGYNPTDFLRTRAVVEPLSADPTALREDRLGTLMLRAQQLWQGGSVTAAFAPSVKRPSAIYTNLNLPSFDPMLDRTNAQDRFLVKGSVNAASNFSPEFLLYHEGNQLRTGVNLAAGFGQKVIAYAEWSGGTRASLLDDALRYGRDTGTLPAGAPAVLPDSSHESFQNELSVGASYTSENRITFNLEYHFNQAGFTRADWRNWFAAGRDSPAASPARRELWYVRAYAQDQQEPLSRHSVFLRADWVDAFVPKLELVGFVNVDAYDGSGLLQMTADYYLSDRWTVGGLLSSNFGGAQTDFGSLPQSTGFLLRVARYF